MKNSSAKVQLTLETIAIGFICIVLLIFTTIVFYRAQELKEQFMDEHKAVANKITQLVAAEIGNTLDAKRQVVDAFVKNNSKLLGQVLNSKDQHIAYEKLNNTLQSYFVDFFSSNISLETGELLFDEFDGNIGQQCIIDLQSYVKSGRHVIQVHPNPNVYHFDIISQFTSGSNKYLVFVSFNTSKIDTIIRLSQPKNHQLLLIKDDLIEVSDKGDRSNLVGRLNFNLTDLEKKRILSSAKVNNTNWEVV